MCSAGCFPLQSLLLVPREVLQTTIRRQIERSEDPVSTRRRFDVDTTLFGRQQRCYDVETSRVFAEEYQLIDNQKRTLPIERSLGVSWCFGNDSLCYQIMLKNSPLTRRGMLSSVSSDYDPLGFWAPFLLFVKQLLCSNFVPAKRVGMTKSPTTRESYRDGGGIFICLLTEVKIRRCTTPKDFGKVCETSLYHFSDATTGG